MARLRILMPESPPIERELIEEQISIGRTADNLLQIEEGSVSSRHAELSKLDTGGWLLRDLNSTNGTFVNGEPIEEALLKDGDTIRFGKIEARYLDTPEADTTQPADQSEAPAQESAQALLVAQTSIRPANFVSSSPFPRQESSKNSLRTAFIAAGIIGIIAGLAAAAIAFFTVQPPQFPAP